MHKFGNNEIRIPEASNTQKTKDAAAFVCALVAMFALFVLVN